VRALCRLGTFTSPTCGLAPGYAQANLVVLPAAHAADFAAYCARNPQACPLLETTPAGAVATTVLASGDVDLRADLPGYNVYRHGVLAATVTNVVDLWQVWARVRVQACA
jgi:uncharacterized protein YcsI (UPF0317 family)